MLDVNYFSITLCLSNRIQNVISQFFISGELVPVMYGMLLGITVNALRLRQNSHHLINNILKLKLLYFDLNSNKQMPCP